ncbi:MAG: DUF4279 domain-containing protein [Candidatus Kapaibacterium sp.]|nr:DUF4279 domain-containing protein [Bacteroidota bacterium]
MNQGNTYVYFALKGDDFNPQLITDRLRITPTQSWRKGDAGSAKPYRDFSYWEISTEKGIEYLLIENVVNQIVDMLFDYIETINTLKEEYNLISVLEIVLYVDINQLQSTPALGHDLRTIEFLYRTQTTIDVDIYRFNSLETCNSVSSSG